MRIPFVILSLALLLAVFIPGEVSRAAAGDLLIEVQAGKHARENCVVSCPLPAGTQIGSDVHLVTIDGGKSLPAQVDNSSGQPQLYWLMETPLPAGESRRYRLAPGSASGEALPLIQVTKLDRKVDIQSGGRPVLSYNTALVEAPNRKESYYDKSGYIHPLYSPKGEILSDDFNPDHPHQHGIMFAWRKMIYEGRETNGWDQKTNTGAVVHHQLGKLTSGPVFGEFNAEIHHQDLTAPGGPLTILKEIWTVRVYATPDQYLFDLRTVQNCATDKPVTIAKIHYGGMTLRGRADWAKTRNYDFITSEGRNKENGNQTRPEWVEIFGPIGQTSGGVTMLCRPDNFRFPQPVRLHPTMPYLCFTAASLEEFQIVPGVPYTANYRFSTHDETNSPGENLQLWHDLSDPPVVTVLTATP